uniref:ATP synthase CF1 delta subunit n=1 Tax=Porphyridium aerugineum TaxID=2792 RepID=UPI001FCCED35|nr:ATP synthase CF1 delta subunit [Porphyridium aerugineum]UNJ17965.1 ATP synthase CF1 delta subunit [Porphyridium aerugineum]
MSEKKVSSKIAQPYAEALLETAFSSNNLQKVTDDIQNIKNTISSSAELSRALNNPLLTIKNKQIIINKLFKDKISSLTLNFLMLIIERKRAVLIEAICKQFITLSYNKSGITIANVISSTPFTEQQYSLLVKKVQEIANSKQVQLNVEIDRELIGGFTIQIGSQIIDSSLKGQLKQMASHLEIA